MKKCLKAHWFEISIVILYIVLGIFYPAKIILSLKLGGILILKVLPIFLCVMYFAGFLSNFISKETVQKVIGKESGIIGMIVGILLGTVFVGPLWIMFPLYNELLQKGAKMSIIGAMMATFAIKTPWIPYAATFLGWKFMGLTLLFIIIYAIIQGYLMELILAKKVK